jgi:hypothetical protein
MNVHDMADSRWWASCYHVPAFRDRAEFVGFIKRVQHDALLAALSLSDDIGKGLIIKLMQEHGLEIESGIKNPKSS